MARISLHQIEMNELRGRSRWHNPAHALFQAILENPDDDGPRLVYADWLLENGATTRGELIQIQCALDFPMGSQAYRELQRRTGYDGFNPPDKPRRRHPQREKLEAREDKILRSYLAREWSDYRPWLHGCHWNRGFIEWAHTEASTFIDCIDEIVSEIPLQRIDLVSMKREHFSKLAKKSGLRRIRALSITDEGVGSHSRRRTHALGPKQAEIFFGSPNVVGLRALEIDVHPADDDGAVIVMSLAGSPYLHGLEELELSSGISVGGLETLSTKAQFFRSLKALDITRTGPEYQGGLPTVPIGQGRHVVGLLERARSIEYLAIEGWNIGDEGVKALAAAPAFASLRTIVLTNNQIGDAGARALAESPHLKHLHTIKGLVVRRKGGRFESVDCWYSQENDNSVRANSPAAKALASVCRQRAPTP